MYAIRISRPLPRASRAVQRPVFKVPRGPAGAAPPSVRGRRPVQRRGSNLPSWAPPVKENGGFFRKFFRSGAPGRARRGPELGKPGIIQCDGQNKNELLTIISQPEFLNSEIEILLFASRFEF